MSQRSGLDAWLSRSDNSQLKFPRQTLLDGWVLSVPPVTPHDPIPPNLELHGNTLSLEMPSITSPLNNGSDGEDDRAAVDLYGPMPALNSDSEDGSVDSDSVSDTDVSDHEIAVAPMDGYLWNLVPPANYQYLDADTLHTFSSDSVSSEDMALQSDDDFVCHEEEDYSEAEALLLIKMFPKNAHCFQKHAP